MNKRKSLQRFGTGVLDGDDNEDELDGEPDVIIDNDFEGEDVLLTDDILVNNPKNDEKL